MSTDQIANTLAEHEPKMGIRDGRPHCICGWAAGSTGGHRDHQADMLAPIIEAREHHAWKHGFKQGGSMHDVNCDDPGAHTRNPFRARAGDDA